MYDVMQDADGKYVLTRTGWIMPFWFSDYRYDSYTDALLLSPDEPL